MTADLKSLLEIKKTERLEIIGKIRQLEGQIKAADQAMQKLIIELARVEGAMSTLENLAKEP